MTAVAPEALDTFYEHALGRPVAVAFTLEGHTWQVTGPLDAVTGTELVVGHPVGRHRIPVALVTRLVVDAASVNRPR